LTYTTIAAYYQILEDCLIAERIDPLTHTKTRRKLTKMPKYLFFDLDVRRACAEEGIKLPSKYMGQLFAQWVGLELIRYTRQTKKRTKVYFWRDANANAYVICRTPRKMKLADKIYALPWQELNTLDDILTQS